MPHSASMEAPQVLQKSDILRRIRESPNEDLSHVRICGVEEPDTEMSSLKPHKTPTDNSNGSNSSPAPSPQDQNGNNPTSNQDYKFDKQMGDSMNKEEEGDCEMSYTPTQQQPDPGNKLDNTETVEEGDTTGRTSTTNIPTCADNENNINVKDEMMDSGPKDAPNQREAEPETGHGLESSISTGGNGNDVPSSPTEDGDVGDDTTNANANSRRDNENHSNSDPSDSDNIIMAPNKMPSNNHHFPSETVLHHNNQTQESEDHKTQDNRSPTQANNPRHGGVRSSGPHVSPQHHQNNNNNSSLNYNHIKGGKMGNETLSTVNLSALQQQQNPRGVIHYTAQHQQQHMGQEKRKKEILDGSAFYWGCNSS